MHIGFDISQTGSGKAGCGFFTHAMITAMLASAPQHRYALYPSFGDFFLDPQMPAGTPYNGTDVQYGQRHVTMDDARAFWTQDDLETVLGNPDIVHSNNFWTPAQIARSRLIYTLYDVGFIVDPKWTTEANRIGCFEGVFRSAVAADWIIAISHYSRDHYLKTFPHFPAERIVVVHPCSRFTDTRRSGAVPKILEAAAPHSFWLSVGTIEPRKNQRMLVLAYKRYLDAGGRPMPLVLTGGKGWLMDDFRDHVGELGLSDKVILTGYVSDDELIWLYRNCYASLYPSLFEGFGLPVLEGMQFGAATLCSNTTSLPEVAGDAALQLSPEAPEAWTRAMLELAADNAKREALSVAGQRRAAEFDWKRSAAALLNIYEQAMRSPKRSHVAQTSSPVQSTAA
jgi:glycosyltransferase involved in cell wall biosynthesis